MLITRGKPLNALPKRERYTKTPLISRIQRGTTVYNERHPQDTYETTAVGRPLTFEWETSSMFRVSGTRVCTRSSISSSSLYGSVTPTYSPRARTIFQSWRAIPGGGNTIADLRRTAREPVPVRFWSADGGVEVVENEQGAARRQLQGQTGTMLLTTNGLAKKNARVSRDWPTKHCYIGIRAMIRYVRLIALASTIPSCPSPIAVLLSASTRNVVNPKGAGLMQG